MLKIRIRKKISLFSVFGFGLQIFDLEMTLPDIPVDFSYIGIDIDSYKTETSDSESNGSKDIQ
jgi:hypothetical protein